MIASLPMYWRTENAEAWRALWAAVDLDLPPLTGVEDLPADWDAHWRAPDLALSQTCGLPYRARLYGDVVLVGAFDAALPDTPPGSYHSVVVTRDGETRPENVLRLAYNAPDSQSGWAVTEGAVFAGYSMTGAHRASAQAVADGEADIAFIDAVTWRLMARSDPAIVQALEVRRRTAPCPGLPLIAAPGADPERLRVGLHNALQSTHPEDRAALGGLRGVVAMTPDAYLRMPLPAPPPA